MYTNIIRIGWLDSAERAAGERKLMEKEMLNKKNMLHQANKK
jgi:hypothetical protein